MLNLSVFEQKLIEYSAVVMLFEM